MFCSNCGKQVREGAKFCSACGKEMQRKTAEEPELQENATSTMEMKQAGKKKKGGFKQFVAGLFCGVIIFSVIAAVLLAKGGFVFDTANDTGYLFTGRYRGTNVVAEDASVEPAPEITIEGVGFDTPEEAAVAYLEAMKAGDVGQILSTFAVETYVDNFDFAGMINYYKSYSFSYQQRLDTIDTYTRALNIGKRTSDLYEALTRQYVYLSDEEMADRVWNMISISESYEGAEYAYPEDFIDELMNQEWLSKLSKMEIGEVYSRDEIFYLMDFDEEKEEHYFEYIGRECWKYGCEDITDLAVEFQLDGENYCLIMQVACYGDKWYNQSLYGYFSSIFGLSTMNAGMAAGVME